MRITSVFLVGVLIAVAASAVSIWYYPSTSDFAISNSGWNGLSELSPVCTIKTISSLNELSLSSTPAVLLAIPQKPYAQKELTEICEFVSNGGTILLADDFGYGNIVLSVLGVSPRFSQATLIDPLFYYRDEHFPRILDVSSKLSAQGITNLVLNYAAILQQTQGAEVLASSSKASYLDLNGNGEYDQNEPKGPFAVAASISLGKGVVELLSDSSIPINAALGLDDNLRFIQYLVFSTGATNILLVDRSHLIQTPSEISRAVLSSIREIGSKASSLLILLGVLFTGVSWNFISKKEDV